MLSRGDSSGSTTNSALDGVLGALSGISELVLCVTGGGGGLVLEALDLGLELTDEVLELVEGSRVGHGRGRREEGGEAVRRNEGSAGSAL